MQIKSEFYDYGPSRHDQQLDFGRNIGNASPAIVGHELSSSLPSTGFQYGYALPYLGTTEEFDRLRTQSSVGKAPPLRKSRKLSMNDARPRPVQTGPRTMSFSMPSQVQAWDGIHSGMQNFGPAAADAIFDSPTTPALELDEQSKKQRRRECHNQVEKRRREHINFKIEELSRLLPAQYVISGPEEEEEEVVGDSPKKKKRSGSTNKKDLMQCKGQVLTQSVQYIHDLRHLTEIQASRIQQLESMLSALPMPNQGWNPLQPSQASPEPELQAVWPVFEPSPFSSGSQSSPDQPAQQHSVHIRKDAEVDNQLGMGGMDLDMMLEQKWH